AGPLERGAVADQEPLPGGEGRRHRHDQRDREAEGMRAGDHHYRDHALQREAELAARTEPRNERKRPAPDGNEREPQGGPGCSRAREAPSTERISIQWPSSMMSISVAVSQKNTLPGSPKTTSAL